MTLRTSLSTTGKARRALLRLGVFLGTSLVTGALDAQTTGKIKVAAVYTAPIAQPWISRVHEALLIAQSRGQIEYLYAANTASADYEDRLREYARQGAQLILGEAFGDDGGPAYRVAPDYPHTAFMIGSGQRPQLPNLSIFDNHIQEPTYLSGMIAGGASQSGIIGLVAGYPVPEINRLLHAFMDGVREINPDTKFLITFIHSRYDPLKARRAALAQMDQGADVIYAERIGVAEAAVQRGKLIIGSTIDIQRQYPETVITSAVWNLTPTIERVLTMVQRGTFKADDYGMYSQMRYQGASLAPLSALRDKLPRALLESVQIRQQAMLDGRFTIKPNMSTPQSDIVVARTQGKSLQQR